MPEEENIKKHTEELRSGETSKEKMPQKELPDLDLEKSFEKLPEANTEQEKEVSEEISTMIKEDKSVTLGVAPITDRFEREKKIEEFLAIGLDDFFLKMDASKQQEFKQKGEETADDINKLLDKTKIKVKKIVDLIKKWLSIIPGVSKIFLEQEAKNRTDKIIKLKKID